MKFISFIYFHLLRGSLILLNLVLEKLPVSVLHYMAKPLVIRFPIRDTRTHPRARQKSWDLFESAEKRASEFHINNVSRAFDTHFELFNRGIGDPTRRRRRVKFVNATIGAGRLSIALSANTTRGKLWRCRRVDDFTVPVPDNHEINPRERVDAGAAARNSTGDCVEFYHVVHARVYTHACIINWHGEIRQRASARPELPHRAAFCSGRQH